jgi:prepilin-type N-terminal cleavage/methylation domain-containing protein
MNKKAFSLVELAMVLVIIGVLIVMGVKTYSMVTSARVKQQLLSIDTIGNALNTYYSMYGILPGDNLSAPNGIITTSTPNSVELLIQAGLVEATDFFIKDSRQDVIGSWRFVRCVTRPGGGYTVLNSTGITAANPRGNVCLSGDNSSDVYANTFTGAPYLPESLMAGYELYYDNLDLDNGTGRQIGGTIALINSRKEFMSRLSSLTPFENYFVKVW